MVKFPVDLVEKYIKGYVEDVPEYQIDFQEEYNDYLDDQEQIQDEGVYCQDNSSEDTS